jgi:hypothetical protein
VIDRFTRWLSWALVGAAALFATLYAARPISTWDFWWHVRSGQEIIEERSIPEFDSFSHTAGDRLWINHEWLFDVILYPIWGSLGGHPIRIACGLILAGTILLAARIAYRWTRSAPLTALLTLGFLGLYFGNIHVRPQILSYPFFLWFFDRFFFRKDPPGWPLLAGAAAVMVFWANIHAVALLPVLFYVAWLVAESLSGPLSARLPLLAAPPGDRLPWRGHLVPFLLILACTFASPNTWRLHQYALAGSSAASTFVSEWAPFYFDYARNRNLPVEIYLTVIASVALYLLWLLAHAIQRRRLDGAEVAMATSCFYFVLTGRRWLWMALLPMAIALKEEGALRAGFRWWGPAAAPQRDAGKRRRRRPPRGEERAIPAAGAFIGGGRAPGRQVLALILTIVVSAVLISPFRKFLPVRQAWETVRTGGYLGMYVNPANIPNDSAVVLREAGLTGNLFNFYGWGGFLLYTLYPECRVFVDGRAILFPPEVIRDMGMIGHHLAGAPELLDRYRVAITVMPEPWRPPERRPGTWIPLFRGAREAVYGRAGSENASRAAAYYAGLGIAFEPSEGFVAAAAMEANPEWARRRQVLKPDLMETLEPLYEELRSGGRGPRDEVALRQRLAEGFLRAGLGDSAAREFRLAYALDPADPFTVLNLANLEMQRGRVGIAKRVLMDYMAVNPDDRQARALLRQVEQSP